MTSIYPRSLPAVILVIVFHIVLRPGAVAVASSDQLFTWERIAHYCVMARDSDAMTRGLHVIEPHVSMRLRRHYALTAVQKKGPPTTFHTRLYWLYFAHHHVW